MTERDRALVALGGALAGEAAGVASLAQTHALETLVTAALARRAPRLLRLVGLRCGGGGVSCLCVLCLCVIYAMHRMPVTLCVRVRGSVGPCVCVSVCPCESRTTEPGEHCLQYVRVSWNFPAAHSSHFKRPISGWMKPDEHSMHRSAPVPGMTEPMGQRRHWNWPGAGL